MAKKLNKIFVAIMTTSCLSLAGCSTSSLLVPKDEIAITAKKYNLKKDITNQHLTDEEKQYKMQNWWAQFNSPELIEIIKNAQDNSPTIGAALVNIKNYETALVASRSKITPNLSGNVGLTNSYGGSNLTNYANSNQISFGLKTTWEMDLFGKNALINESNKKQIENAKAAWHDARTIVAAEAARTYFNYKFCKRILSVLNQDYEARKSQNEITKLKVQAGFEAETSFFQNEAGLSQSQSNILAQEALCDTYVKSLVALTAIEEDKLRGMLREPLNDSKKIDLYVPVSVPAELLNQRPDIVSAVNKIQIAALDVAKVKADALPTVAFNGSITGTLNTTLGVSSTGSSFSLGPITVTLPILDGGVRDANEALALQKYEQAKLEFSSNLRNAIKEIEISMINLSSRNDRLNLIERSVENYKNSYEATMETYRAGISDLFDLEASRRNYLTEVNGQINNELETLNAWIDLYKAVGGGFKKTEEING